MKKGSKRHGPLPTSLVSQHPLSVNGPRMVPLNSVQPLEAIDDLTYRVCGCPEESIIYHSPSRKRKSLSSNNLLQSLFVEAERRSQATDWCTTGTVPGPRCVQRHLQRTQIQTSGAHAASGASPRRTGQRSCGCPQGPPRSVRHRAH